MLPRRGMKEEKKGVELQVPERDKVSMALQAGAVACGERKGERRREGGASSS